MLLLVLLLLLLISCDFIWSQDRLRKQASKWTNKQASKQTTGRSLNGRIKQTVGTRSDLSLIDWDTHAERASERVNGSPIDSACWLDGWIMREKIDSSCVILALTQLSSILVRKPAETDWNLVPVQIFACIRRNPSEFANHPSVQPSQNFGVSYQSDRRTCLFTWAAFAVVLFDSFSFSICLCLSLSLSSTGSQGSESSEVFQCHRNPKQSQTHRQLLDKRVTLLFWPCLCCCCCFRFASVINLSSNLAFHLTLAWILTIQMARVVLVEVEVEVKVKLAVVVFVEPNSRHKAR